MKKMTLTECSKKRLNETYLVAYAIKNEINIKKAEYIEKGTIYTLIGIDILGNRQLLNIYQEKTNNKRYWLDCFEGLKARGIKNILFLSVDDNKNMKRTAKLAFPDIVFVDAITDIIPRFNKYSTERNTRGINSKIHDLYTKPTLSEFKTYFNEFQKTYNNVIHKQLISKYLSNLESLYKYSVNIRLLLFKHSANIKLYDKIRISFNYNSSYIEGLDEVYDKLGNIDDYFGFTSFKKNEWTLILNDLITMYPKLDFI